MKRKRDRDALVTVQTEIRRAVHHVVLAAGALAGECAHGAPGLARMRSLMRGLVRAADLLEAASTVAVDAFVIRRLARIVDGSKEGGA
jgi:hypothetical protein